MQFHITLQEHPTTTYNETRQFIQGQHSIPPGFEQRITGMHPGESKTFPLSMEEGFGPHDATKLHMISRRDLPVDIQEGDIIIDDTGRHAQIIWIFPEVALIDLNHPLAGQPLIVTLQIVTIENQEEDLRTDTVPGHNTDPKRLIVGPETHDGSPEHNMQSLGL